MSEDLQGNRWWLASDGKWYPPELHPDLHAAAPEEQDRNAALLSATIGVARVRDRVFAEVRRDRRAEHSSTPEDAEAAAASVATGHASDKEPPSRRARESLPRYREARDWAGDTDEASQTAGTRPAPRWAPGTRDPRRPSPWLETGDETSASSVTSAPLQGAPTSSSPPSNPPRWGARTISERTWPPPRVAPPPPPPPSGQTPATGLEATPPAERSDTAARPETAGTPPFSGHEGSGDQASSETTASSPLLHPPSSVEHPLPPPAPSGSSQFRVEEVAASDELDEVIQAALAPVESSERASLAEKEQELVPPSVENPIVEVSTAPAATLASPPFLRPSANAERTPDQLGSNESETVSTAPDSAEADREQSPPAPQTGEDEAGKRAAGSEDAASFDQSDASFASESESKSPSGARVVPPSGRRRPTRVRSASDLRDAVADAVARAAAQGPLTPRGPEDESEPGAGPVGQEPSALWPASHAQTGVEGTVATSSGEQPPLYGPVYPAALIDPYEEFAVLASQHMMALDAPITEGAGTDAALLEMSPTGPEPAPEASEVSQSTAQAEQTELEAQVPEASLLEDLLLDDASISVPQDSLLEDLLLDSTGAGDIETGEEVAITDLGVIGVVGAEKTSTASARPRARANEEGPEGEGPGGNVVATEKDAEEELVFAEVVEGTENEETTSQGPTFEDSGAEPEVDNDGGEDPNAKTDEPSDEETPFPFGERRSAARQARKPLPAALQEAVAAGAAHDRGATSSQPKAAPGSRTRQRSKNDPKMGLASNDPQDNKKPGIIRRYGSAIAIVVLFLAAGGVAAAVAAFHGPVTPPAPSTRAQDQAAASGAVLGPGEFFAPWSLSRVSGAAFSYGLGSALVTPSLVRAWLAGNPTCSPDLLAVTAAMTPTVGSVTAVAYSQATTTTPLGAKWDIADAVAFHSDSGEVETEIHRMQSVLSRAEARRCVARFWSACLQNELPGYLVAMTVSLRPMPQLAGRPLSSEMEMQGTATNGASSVPLRFEFTSFAAGRAEAYFAVSSDGTALPALTAARELSELATNLKNAAATTT